MTQACDCEKPCGGGREIVDLYTPLFEAVGGRLYRLHILSAAAAILMGDGTSVEGRINTLERLLAQNSTTRFAANIADRDALAGVTPGDICHVKDASQDPLVGSGSATYLRTPDLEWKLLYLGESPLDPSALIAPGGGLTEQGRRLAVKLADLINPDKGLVIESGKLSVDASKLVSSGGGLALDSGGKISVDFSQMPTDKFEALLRSLRLPVWLTSDLDLYVATTGVDGPGRGTASAPFRTIQFAVDYLAENVNVASFQARIHVAAGTYEESLSLREYDRVAGSASIIGHGQVIISSDGLAPYFTLSADGGAWSLYNLRVVQSGVASASETGGVSAIQARGGATSLRLQNVAVEIEQAVPSMPALGAITASSSAIVIISDGCSILAEKSAQGGDNCCHALIAMGNADIELAWDATAQLNIQGDYAVVAWAQSSGLINRSVVQMPAIAGSATGARYRCDTSGGINTYSGGAEYFPGSAEGSADATTFSWYK